MAMFDSSMIMPIVVIGIIAAAAWILWKKFASKTKSQPITKDQYQRLISDLLTSCKLNRIKNTKWMNMTGDSNHPPIRHFAKYIGSVADARGVWLAWRVRWFTSKRVGPVTRDLIHAWGEREIWVDCNGFVKDGYFVTPVLTWDHCKNGRAVEDYDTRFNHLIKVFLGIQALHDTFEQSSYEVMSAMAHRERSMADLMVIPEDLEYKQSEREYPVEPEG
jgi:hypothetical protein